MENQIKKEIEQQNKQISVEIVENDESETKQQQQLQQKSQFKQTLNLQNENQISKLNDQNDIHNNNNKEQDNIQVNQLNRSEKNQNQIQKIQDNSISQNNYQAFPQQCILNKENIQKQQTYANDSQQIYNLHQNYNEENMTQTFDQFEDHHDAQQNAQDQNNRVLQNNKLIQKIENQQNLNFQSQKEDQNHQLQIINKQKNQIQVNVNNKSNQNTGQQKQINLQTNKFNGFAAYQNEVFNQIKKQQNKQIKEQKNKQQQEKEKVQKTDKKKKSKKKKTEQQSQALPIISQEPINKQQLKESQNNIPVSQGADSNRNNKKQDKIKSNPTNKKNETDFKIEQAAINKHPSDIQVSQIIEPASVAANVIIFQAQKQRIATVLQYFNQFVNKHQKHIKNQKSLIKNIYDEIQKKRIFKQGIFNALKEYFLGYASISKQFYEKSYKISKSDKIFSLNPLINMKQQLKAGIEQLIVLRKSTGNQYHRLSDFISNTIQKSLIKAFMQYWGVVNTAQNKHKQKRDEFIKKQKEFQKRISKVEKIYSKGKIGISQEQDLFIEMNKFINQQKQYRKYLIEYGISLIPLKKAFIKAEETLYEQLQTILNYFKNQSRNIYCLHKNQFTLIQKFQKQIKQNNSFQKLSDLMDSDYVKSVLLAHQRKSYPNITDKQFQKIFNMIHFESVVGNSSELLKGTTSKSFDLKNISQQVVDTISGNLLIFNKQTSQMRQKFIMANVNAKIIGDGIIEIEQIIKGIIFDSNKNVKLTFRDNDRAEQLICFINQVQQSQAQGLKNKK